VALLGGVVGASELISRYKDDPSAALRSWPAIIYIAINSTASAGALGLIHANGWFGMSRWTQILVAGVSAMAFFRTSLFRGAGRRPGRGCRSQRYSSDFLAAADRAVDRGRAAARSDAVARVMTGIDFDRAVKALPFFGLMRGVSADDQQVLEQASKTRHAGDGDQGASAGD